MAAHRCFFCQAVLEDPAKLSPMLLGTEIHLICSDCLISKRVLDGPADWENLKRRQSLNQMGWLFGGGDEDGGYPFDTPAIDLSDVSIDPAATRLISPDLARKHRLIPVLRMGSALVIAMADPEDRRAREEIRSLTGMEVEVAYAPEEEVADAIRQHYGPPSCPARMSDEIDIGPLLDDVRDDTILNLVNLILSELIRSSATEVHIERNAKQVQVLYRIDGLLHVAMQPPRQLGHRLIACFRLLGNLRSPRKPKKQEATVRLRTRRGNSAELHLFFRPHASGEILVVTRMSE